MQKLRIWSSFNFGPGLGRGARCDWNLLCDGLFLLWCVRCPLRRLMYPFGEPMTALPYSATISTAPNTSRLYDNAAIGSPEGYIDCRTAEHRSTERTPYRADGALAC